MFASSPSGWWQLKHFGNFHPDPWGNPWSNLTTAHIFQMAWEKTHQLIAMGPNTTGWWFQIFFIFTPTWGRWTHFDEHIFQRGWFNHQLDKIIWKSPLKSPNIQVLLPLPERQNLWWGPTGPRGCKVKPGEKRWTSRSCEVTKFCGFHLFFGVQMLYSNLQMDFEGLWWCCYSNILDEFLPRFVGRWSNLTSIFFRWVGSTTN